jgi:hypothetical protein
VYKILLKCTKRKMEVSLLFKGESEAIVDPSQYELMKPNLVLTKTFSDEESRNRGSF